MRMNPSPRPIVAFSLVVLAFAGPLSAQERRAKPPQFSQARIDQTFFDELSQAIRGTRPDWATLRDDQTAAPTPAGPSPTTKTAESGDSRTDRWSRLVSASSLEDEIKRLRLEFDATVTTPGAFSGGGYRDARRHLSILAMAFAVVDEFGEEVRWKDQARLARDLMARTAANCKTGSTQVYNEAKLRQQDLQDLVSGGGLQERATDERNDWVMIVERGPLMEYAESLLDRMQDATRSGAAFSQAADSLVRDAQMLAIVGTVLQAEGMIDADDEDYNGLSQEMVDAATSLAAAGEREDAESARAAVGTIGQSCVNCHDQYR